MRRIYAILGGVLAVIVIAVLILKAVGGTDSAAAGSVPTVTVTQGAADVGGTASSTTSSTGAGVVSGCSGGSPSTALVDAASVVSLHTTSQLTTTDAANLAIAYRRAMSRVPQEPAGPAVTEMLNTVISTSEARNKTEGIMKFYATGKGTDGSTTLSFYVDYSEGFYYIEDSSPSKVVISLAGPAFINNSARNAGESSTITLTANDGHWAISNLTSGRSWDDMNRIGTKIAPC